MAVATETSIPREAKYEANSPTTWLVPVCSGQKLELRIATRAPMDGATAAPLAAPAPRIAHPARTRNSPSAEICAVAKGGDDALPGAAVPSLDRAGRVRAPATAVAGRGQ